MTQTNLRPNNLKLLSRDQGYRFGDEPDWTQLYRVRTAINQANLFTFQIQNLVFEQTGKNIAARTIDNLMNGKTKSPQLRTVSLIMTALGYKMEWTRKG